VEHEPNLIRRPEVFRDPGAALLDRRRLLAWFGGIGLATLLPGCTGEDEAGSTTATGGGTTPAATTSPELGAGGTPIDCVLTPELTEGPFYLDLDRVRRDITEGRDGLPFDLRIHVVDADSCDPIKDAAVDVWHCNASGTYSGVQGDSGTFLRGIQVTDTDGAAEFRTIFPGWYQGRAVHVHLKVHLGGVDTFTGQLFFDDDTLAAIYARDPYAGRGEADTSNEADGIFGESDGTTVVDVAVGDDSCSGTVTLGVRRA
jgi:protocatechuate 3,4-dioxygenase beta subunit